MENLNNAEIEGLDFVNGKSDYWNNENSNKNGRLVSTQRDYLAGIISTHITKNYLIDEEILVAHENGIIHFHDMDYFAQNVLNNCELCNLNDMLQYGTVINGIYIEKPHRLITASTISTQIILAVSSSTYGGCTVSLAHLAPFVRDSYNYFMKKYKKYNLNEKIIKQLANDDLNREIINSVQTFNYQINSMTSTNGQAPFLSLYMDINENKEYQKEIAMLIEEFLNQRLQGLKNKDGVYITQAFPKLLYVLDENNIYPNSEYYYLTELAAKTTAKRMVPDYISAKIMRECKGDVYPCMGCRSFLTPYHNKNNISHAKDFNENNGKYYGRFNQGVVTLSLPDIAFSSNRDFDKFWKIFDERLQICHKALKIRSERLEKGVSDMSPILWQDGALARLKPHESIKDLIHNGYSTISLGFAGLYECVKFMTGKSHSSDESKDFGIKIMEHLNEACCKWKNDENIDYSVYGTPIESTTYKFAKCLKKRFGEDIFVKLDGKDRNFITNSYHVPVFEKIDPFEKLRIESEFQKLSPGGAISYIECCDLTRNVEVIMEVLKFIYDTIMYAELNTKSDYCSKCGFSGEIKIIDKNNKLIWECPNCGNNDTSLLYVCRRTCGYLGTNYFNQGRTDEIRNRYVHIDDINFDE